MWCRRSNFLSLLAKKIKRKKKKRRKRKNLTSLLIEHKLREFMQLVSRVVALDFGEVIAEGTPAEIVSHPRVIEAYIGKQAPEVFA